MLKKEELRAVTQHGGGCLCGALRYTIEGEPLYAGFCCCGDCRKASGAGMIPYMGYSSSAVSFSGEARQYVSRSAGGGEAVRNFCPSCGGLVFGGRIGVDTMFTIYAGSLDDPARFEPTAAIFNRDRPYWSVLPRGLALFETMPAGD